MKFTLIQGNEWQGAYLNGVLITQNSTLSATELLRNLDGYLIGAGRISLEVLVADEDRLEELGAFPELLVDAPVKK